jgi:hypothetical protein
MFRKQPGNVTLTNQGLSSPKDQNPSAPPTLILGILRDRTAPMPSKIARAPRSSLLPLQEFELAILRAVSEAGGEASRSILLEVLGQTLENRLTDLDREPLISGKLRWQTRVDQARNGLVKRGLLESSHPGIWKLTEAGNEYLDRRLKSKAAAERRAA